MEEVQKQIDIAVEKAMLTKARVSEQRIKALMARGVNILHIEVEMDSGDEYAVGFDEQTLERVRELVGKRPSFVLGKKREE